MPKTKTPRSKKPRYEAVLNLPPVPPDQYEALRANIAVHGVLVPILVDSDGTKRKIIDGNTRKAIAEELGYDCPEIMQPNLDEDEKRTLARALNLVRRQLRSPARTSWRAPISSNRGKPWRTSSQIHHIQMGWPNNSAATPWRLPRGRWPCCCRCGFWRVPAHWLDRPNPVGKIGAGGQRRATPEDHRWQLPQEDYQRTRL